MFGLKIRGIQGYPPPWKFETLEVQFEHFGSKFGYFLRILRRFHGEQSKNKEV